MQQHCMGLTLAICSLFRPRKHYRDPRRIMLCVLYPRRTHKS